MSFNIARCCTTGGQLGVRKFPVTGELVLHVLFLGDLGNLVLRRELQEASLDLTLCGGRCRHVLGDIILDHLELPMIGSPV